MADSSNTDGTYEDRRIVCSSEGIRIRGYYFPWGSKRVPYSSIRSVRRVELGPLRGRMRIWGTANLRYWANLDPQRPRKQIGFILDLARSVQPFITPDDPAGFEEALRRNGVEAISDSDGQGPII